MTPIVGKMVRQDSVLKAYAVVMAMIFGTAGIGTECRGARAFREDMEEVVYVG